MPRLIALIGIFATSLSSAAPTVVEDPSRILEKADRFVGARALSTTYQVGDTASFDRMVRSCTVFCFGVCMYRCEPYDRPVAVVRGVYACTTEKATITSDDGSFEDITSAEFDASFANPARLFLARFTESTGIDAKLRVTDAKEIQVATGPSATPLDALEIKADTILGEQQGPEITLTLVRGAPGVAQIARLKVGEDTVFRLKSWSRNR